MTDITDPPSDLPIAREEWDDLLAGDRPAHRMRAPWRRRSTDRDGAESDNVIAEMESAWTDLAALLLFWGLALIGCVQVTVWVCEGVAAVWRLL